MLKHQLVLFGSVAALIAMLLVLFCTLPEDPNDPSNTSTSLLLRTSWKTNTDFVEDTAGNRIQIGSVLHLRENIESVNLKITFGGTVVFDTTYTNLQDTLWKEVVFYSEGVRTVTLTSTSSLGLPAVSASIKIIGKEFQLNHAPVINVVGNTVIKPSEICSLAINTSDVDAAQVLTVFMVGHPTGSQLQKSNMQFVWTPPSGFIGNDTMVITVIDNGQPPQSASQTVILTVTATPHPPKIEVVGDRSLLPLETCSLFVKVSDEDLGQVLKRSVSSGLEGSLFLYDSLFIWTVPADFIGEKVVTFTVTDNGIPPLSSSVQAVLTVTTSSVNKAPRWDAKMLPVPLKDTAKYTKNLMNICRDDDGDAITFALSSGAPAGDTIVGTTYSFTAKPALIGEYKVKIIAIDPNGGTDTLTIDLTVTSSSIADVTPPTITLVSPSKDTSIITTSTCLIDVITGDVSGIASVTATFGTTTLPMQPASGHYTVTMGGLRAGEYNKIELLATDASPAANKSTQTVYVKYSPGYTLTYDGNGSSGGTVPVDSGSYQAGTKITVKANTGSLVKTGATFAEWNTSKDGTGTPCTPGATFTMGNEHDTLFAKWTSKPTYTLTVSAANGSVTRTPDLPVYDSGTVVTLTPVPAANYHFSGWSGALSGLTNPATITMTGVKSVTAMFEANPPNTFALTVTAANGSVTKIPDGTQFDSGTVVSLTPVAAPGYRFSGWSGGLSGTDNPDTITMNSVKSITANFVLVTYTLYVTSNGNGTTTPASSATVNHGVATTLTATPGTGYKFDNWTVATGTAVLANATSATAATVTLASGDATVKANFSLKTYQLTVTAGSGGTAVPASATVNHGVATAITATPGTGYVFAGWTVTTGTATLANATSATAATVTLSSGAATVNAAFKGVTFERVSALTDQFRGVKQLSDGGYMITGNRNMVRLDVNGTQVLSKAYDDNGYGGSGFSASSINLLADGGYIVAGSAYNLSDDDLYLMRFYANGNRQWYKNFGGTYQEIGSFAIQTSDGGFLTGGTSSSFGTNNNDYYIVKTDGSGVSGWTQFYDGGGVERLNDGIATSDGYLLVGGANMGNDIWVVKVNTSGTKVWDNYYKSVSGTGCCGAMLYSVRACSGGFIISGSTTSGASLLMKINSSGTLVWSQTYPNSSSSISAVRETSDGGFVFVASTSAIGNSGSNVYLAKTNSVGTLSWERGLGGNLDEYGFSVELTQDGGYVVVGTSDSKGYIVKTDANGQVTP